MNDPASTSIRKAPGWLAPVLAVVLVLALTWTLGVTVFRGALENRGLPEQIRGADDGQFAQWEYGAQLADLASQAGTLAGLGQKRPAESLGALDESLSRGADLLGELRYSDATPVAQPEDFSPEAATELAQRVLDAGQRSPAVSDGDVQDPALVTRVIFETSLDARSVLAAVAPDLDLSEIPAPFSTPATGDAAEDGDETPLACLADPGLLDPEADIPEEDAASVHAARALDRGYALDYVLQLNAARGTASNADEVESRRDELNDVLAMLRTAFGSDCADIRLLAYELPEDALEDLPALATQLETDLVNELLLATTLAKGEPKRTLAAATWRNLTERQDAGPPVQLLAGR